MRRLAILMSILLACAFAPAPSSQAVESSHLPGVFVVAIKGQLPGSLSAARRQMGRLALYDFRSDGTVTEKYWAWNTALDTPRSAWAGTASDANYCITYVGGTAPDKATAPLCRTNFHDKISTPSILEGEPQTLSGTYTNQDAPGQAPTDGDVIAVNWQGDAGIERWRYSWSTETFAKIELVEFDKFDDPTSFQANDGAAAVNAGWGWGAADTTLRGGLPTTEIASLDENYSGCSKFWNNFYTTPQSDTGCDMLGLSGYTLTNATHPKLRLFTRTPGQTSCQTGGPAASDVYRYFSALDANTQALSVTDRRVQSVVEHDSDCDQIISDSGGHTQMGLQILDSSGAFIGVVMVQSQYNGNTNTTAVYDSIGASYYVRSDIFLADPTD